MIRQRTELRAPRPVRPARAALSKMLSRAWSLPSQRNFVAIERNLRVPMPDGTVLLADHQIAGGAHPRLARNPGNGQVDARAEDFVITHYSIHSPSELVISQATGKEAAHA
jgi:hypothetical protein